jgi:anion-transporting  ArsA/GET3 family ATPase
VKASTHLSSRARARVGPLVAHHDPALVLDVDALLDDRSRSIIVCCGSGGVGKTTTSAALALRAAERGRKVVVLTIDPARRLAQAMGIEALDNTPRPVAGVRASTSSEEGPGDEPDSNGGGSLEAMMLDMKRTFDEVVQSQASPEKAAQILANPFYIAVSSSFAGTQEYMAMEKLGQLDKLARRTGRWDLIIVDTPPSRSALDFLDAPERLASFLDGRFIRLLLTPARGPARLMTAGFGMVTNAVTKIIGAEVLRDMKAFVAAFDTLFGGFRQRAQRTFELLQDSRTAFLVVAAPEPDALREAAYFVERLREEGMPLAGLVVNRASTSPDVELSANAAMTGVEKLRSSGEDHGLAAGLLRLHADRKIVVEREKRLTGRFETSHPEVPTAVLPALSTDVHDLDGLRRIGDLLGAQVETQVDEQVDAHD